jgi:cell pole-organizing protein PopZ
MSSPQHEPTMEEILASIRKIISEDAPADAPPAPADEPAPFQPQPDVLELTQEVVETPPPPQPQFQQHAPFQPAPMAMAEPDDIVFQNDPVPMAPAPANNDIFSDHTRQALENSFAAIPEEEPAPAPALRAASAPMPVDGSSIETVFERAVRESFDPVLQKYLSDNSGAVIERMKPLIREWMDEHFPALLEGAVRAEVERVVKSRGAKR